MKVFDIIELDGNKYKIIGGGYNPNSEIKDYWNARLLDDNGDVLYTKGSGIIISKKKYSGKHLVLKPPLR